MPFWNSERASYYNQGEKEMKLKKGGFIWQCMRFIGYSEGTLLYDVRLNLCKIFWLILLATPFVALFRYFLWVFDQNFDDINTGGAKSVRWQFTIPKILLTIGLSSGIIYLLNPKCVGPYIIVVSIVILLVLVICGLVAIGKAHDAKLARRNEFNKPIKVKSEFWSILALRLKSAKEKVCPIITFQ
jgi:hypothetical protein